jgi:NAD(P)-dependent dehydrogenase (short-subunit alcohol dehydrogenase family)
MRLAIVDSDPVKIDEVVTELKHQPAGEQDPGAILPLTLNVRDEEDMETMAARTLEKFGQIDLLVHCAGILRVAGSGPRFLHQVSLEEWETVIDTNLKGTFLSNRAVLSAMIKQHSGQIINISSTSGLKGRAFDSVYCASKFGVIGLSESLAEEVRQYGIKVQVILPDAVDTPMWDQNGPVQAPKDSLPPERISSLIIFLISLPDDTVLSNLIINPYRARRRKKKV